MTKAASRVLFCEPRIRPGWRPIVERLLEELAALPGAPEIWEIARRPYGLRVRLQPGDDGEGPAWEAAQDAVRRASEQAAATCEICAAPGASLAAVAGERFRIACSAHAGDAPD